MKKQMNLIFIILIVLFIPCCKKTLHVKKTSEAFQSLHKAHAQLLQAAKDGDTQKVTSLLKVTGIDANCKDDTWYKTPLIYAAKKGHTKIVRLLLKAGLTPEQINSKELLMDRTALMYALSEGHKEIVQLIASHLPPEYLITHDQLNLSTSEDACNAQMRELLFSYMTHENFDYNLPALAAYYNDVSLIKDMIKKGFVSELLAGIDGRSALSSAAQEGHEEIIILLLEVGASVDSILKKDKTGKNALMWASLDGHSHIVSRLLEQGLTPDQISQQTSWGETALIMAAKYGHVDVVSLLFNSGISDEQIQRVNSDYDDGYYNTSSLEYAALGGHQKTVELFLEKLQSPLEEKICFRAIAAAANNNGAALQKLLDDPEISISQIMGADIHKRTALIVATQKGHVDIVSFLLHAGITPEHISLQDCNGGTALHYACEKEGYDVIVQKLIESGLSSDQINLSDKYGWTPLMAATSWKHTHIVSLFLKSGLTPEQMNVQNSNGETALIWAIKYINKDDYYKENNEIVCSLIAHLDSEQLSVQDWQKNSALFYAAYEDQSDIVSLLLERLSPEQIVLACEDGKMALDVGYESKKIIQAHLDHRAQLSSELLYFDKLG